MPYFCAQIASLKRGYKKLQLMRQLKITKSITNRESEALEKYLQEIGYVKPGINILLVDYHRLVIYDRLLPAGRLREPVRAKDRADIVIITKCPKDLKPISIPICRR